MKRMAWLVVAMILVGGCATTSRVAQNISLGMTTQEVLRVAGKPFSKNIAKDAAGNAVEEWFYRETTWDDAGWSWDRTIVNSVVTFKNGKVEGFSKDDRERYKTKNPMAPSVNIDATIHNQ